MRFLKQEEWCVPLQFGEPQPFLSDTRRKCFTANSRNERGFRLESHAGLAPKWSPRCELLFSRQGNARAVGPGGITRIELALRLLFEPKRDTPLRIRHGLP